MNNIKLLDCTLRDGGYINNWLFGKRRIRAVIKNLENAQIDIIECGFIRNAEYNSDSTVFNSMYQVADAIYPKKRNCLYSIMIEYHNHVEDIIPDYDGTGADIIRVTFRKNEWNGARVVVCKLIEKGYKVCVQPVGTTSYEDDTLLDLIKEVNLLKPYAFYLVDTLGVMYRDEIRRFFYLIDHNLVKDIALGFHSHNNLQMSFSNAQEILQMARQRNIIIDTSCYGMGRGSGNLATELFADYFNKKIYQKYSLIPILNIVDTCLMPIYATQRWGYDLPYFLSAITKCHPNYPAYLLKKETIGIEKIEKILNLIPREARSEFDRELIDRLYMNIQTYEVDDTSSYEILKTIIGSQDVCIIGPGFSIQQYKNHILERTKGLYVITTNFICSDIKADALFISNDKRLNELDVNINYQIFATSNLKIDRDNTLIFNYASLLGEGDELDNSGAMLIKILKKIGIKKLVLAGFDGFNTDSTSNYIVPTFKKLLDHETVQKKNLDISKQLKLALNEMDYEFITPTKYII